VERSLGLGCWVEALVALWDATLHADQMLSLDAGSCHLLILIGNGPPLLDSRLLGGQGQSWLKQCLGGVRKSARAGWACVDLEQLSSRKLAPGMQDAGRSPEASLPLIYVCAYSVSQTSRPFGNGFCNQIA
jgi:hypothetical protein